MDCTQFQKVLPECIDFGQDEEWEKHAESCPHCSELLSELRTISKEAAYLRETSEPNARVWNRIEIALRQEGLIREPLPQIVPAKRSRWRTAWLVPVAASGMFALGLISYQRLSAPSQVGERIAPASIATVKTNTNKPASLAATRSPEDRQFLAMVASRPPAIRARYEEDLQHVNAYIHDAEQSLQADPNDEMAQQYLMDAYQQKATMYQLALDRSMP